MTAAETILEMPTQNKSDFADEIAVRVSPATVIRRDESLAKHTTLRVGGPADVYVEPVSESDLAAVVKFCGVRGVPFFVIGRGSNLLVRDGGFRGAVICLSHANFAGIESSGEGLRCGAGAKLKNVAVEARRHGLSGLEFLEGIPGSVGGALRMNAGAMGGAAFDVVESVRLMDLNGDVREFVPGELSVAYRRCDTLKDHIALGAVFKGRPDSPESIAQRMSAFSQKRWSSQPAAPSAGCAFKNPPSIPAGKLIDELGLKGARVGGAVVSPEHGNFIVNDGNATARDVLELIEMLKAKAKAERGIELQTEVEIIGEDLNLSDWPFADPKNLAVFSLRSIVFGRNPILHVTHDEDDGSWQFLGLEDARVEDMAIVALKEIIELDSSVAELHDLPLGWHAWRESRKDSWHREQNRK